jgi:hypothetical protein
MCASHGCVRREPVGSGRCLGPEVDLPVCPTRGGRRFLVPEGPPGPERPCTIVCIKMFCVKNRFALEVLRFRVIRAPDPRVRLLAPAARPEQLNRQWPKVLCCQVRSRHHRAVYTNQYNWYADGTQPKDSGPDGQAPQK